MRDRRDAKFGAATDKQQKESRPCHRVKTRQGWDDHSCHKLSGQNHNLTLTYIEN